MSPLSLSLLWRPHHVMPFSVVVDSVLAVALYIVSSPGVAVFS